VVDCGVGSGLLFCCGCCGLAIGAKFNNEDDGSYPENVEGPVMGIADGYIGSVGGLDIGWAKSGRLALCGIAGSGYCMFCGGGGKPGDEYEIGVGIADTCC